MGPQSSLCFRQPGRFQGRLDSGTRQNQSGFYSQGTGSDYTTAIIPVDFPNHQHAIRQRLPAPALCTHSRRRSSMKVASDSRRVRWNNGVPSDPTGLFGYTGDSKVGIPIWYSEVRGVHRAEHQQRRKLSRHKCESSGLYRQYFQLLRQSDLATGQALPLDWRTGHAISAELHQCRKRRISRAVQLQRTIHRPAWWIGYGAAADFVLGRISNVQLASPLGFVGNRQWRVGRLFPGRLQSELPSSP